MDELISFEDYREKYHASGVLLSGRVVKRPAKPLNESQLITQYNTHIRKIKRIMYKRDNSPSDITKDQIISQECRKRDKNRCRLMAALTFAESRELVANSTPLLLNKLDCAHVFGKNAYPKMRYLIDNVVLINRASHGWLDAGKSPINGKPITIEEKQVWWERIAGKKMYGKLLGMSREGFNAER